MGWRMEGGGIGGRASEARARNGQEGAQGMNRHSVRAFVRLVRAVDLSEPDSTTQPRTAQQQTVRQFHCGQG